MKENKKTTEDEMLENNFTKDDSNNFNLKEEKEYSEEEGKRLSDVAIHWKKEYDKIKEDNAILLEALSAIVDLFPKEPKLPISWQILGIANEAMGANNPNRKADIETVKNYHPK